MEVSTLRKVAPFIKEYVKGRGVHEDQKIVRNNSQGNAVAAAIKSTGIVRGPFGSSYCFGAFGSMSAAKGSDVVAIQLQPIFDDLSPDAYWNYIDWIVNASPWAGVFISKNINTIKRRLVVIADAHAKGNTLMGAMIALRQPWENYSNSGAYLNVGLWWDIVSKGVDPAITFLITEAMAGCNRNTKEIILNSAAAGHHPISYYRDKSNYEATSRPKWMLDNFLANSINDDSEPWSKVAQYRAPSSIFNGIKPRTIFQDRALPLLVEIGKVKKEVNPFAANQAEVFKRNVFVDGVAEIVPHLKEKYYAAY